MESGSAPTRRELIQAVDQRLFEMQGQREEAWKKRNQTRNAANIQKLYLSAILDLGLLGAQDARARRILVGLRARLGSRVSDRDILRELRRRAGVREEGGCEDPDRLSLPLLSDPQVKERLARARGTPTPETLRPGSWDIFWPTKLIQSLTGSSGRIVASPQGDSPRDIIDEEFEQAFSPSTVTEKPKKRSRKANEHKKKSRKTSNK